MRTGEHDAALAILRSLVGESAETFHDPLVAYDRRIFGELSHQLIGVALLRMGRVGEAADAFERASAAAPDDVGQRARAVATRAIADKAAASPSL